MFGIGFQEMIVILVLALILIGPKKLPEVAKSIGKAVAELRKAMDDFKGSIDEEIFREEKKVFTDEYKDMEKAYSDLNIADLKETVDLKEKTEDETEKKPG
jgi:Tat protein translocase TatB subunit